MPSFFWAAKDPSDVVDYVIDWTDVLASDTIATATYTAPGLTVNSSSNTSTTSTVWLAGGTAGATCEVTCRITTAGGRTFERTASLRVADM